MFKGSLTFETPMLFAIAFVVLFTIGGLSGLDVGNCSSRFSIS
jgi:cytochrome c oxidase subunit 1